MVKMDKLHVFAEWISLNSKVVSDEIPYFLFAEDLRQCNDKLVEVNSSKMALQMKLDELEAAEVNIKVIHDLVLGIYFIQMWQKKNY